VDLWTVGAVDGPVSLKADLSSRTLTVMGANGVIKTFNVAVGSPNYPTPTGTYTIRKIVWNPSWIPPDSKWSKKETAKGPGEKAIR
jgi:lipoprotein-anchoring transpeptidase ErfK/SrfK